VPTLRDGAAFLQREYRAQVALGSEVLSSADLGSNLAPVFCDLSDANANVAAHFSAANDYALEAGTPYTLTHP
jgi:hypothetical protein